MLLRAIPMLCVPLTAALAITTLLAAAPGCEYSRRGANPGVASTGRWDESRRDRISFPPPAGAVRGREEPGGNGSGAGGQSAVASRAPAGRGTPAGGDGNAVSSGDAITVRPAAPARGSAVTPADNRPARPAAGTSATAVASDGTVRSTLAYPTGFRESSVILLERVAPRQVHLNRPFTYELRVTNLTGHVLADVVVEEEAPETLSVRRLESGDRAGNGAAAPRGTAPGRTEAEIDAAESELAALEARFTATTRPADGPATRPTSGATTRLAEAGSGPGERQADDVQTQQAGDRADDGREAAEPDGDGPRRFVIGDLGPRQTRSIRVEGRASAVGVFAACTSVRYDPMLCATTEVINPVLRLAKSGPREVHVCDEAVYRYTVSNAGTGTARGVTVRETLPPGLASTSGGQGVVLEVGDLPEGGSRSFEVRVRPQRAGEYVNRAVATMSGSDEQVPSDEVTTVVRAGRLAVGVSAAETEYVNKVIAYPITVRNEGDGEARDVKLHVSLGGGGEVIGFAREDGTVPDKATGGRAIGASRGLGTIPPGGSATATLSVRAVSGGPLTVNARAESECLPSAQATGRTTVQTVPALLLEVVDREDPVRVGERTSYQIVVRNQGTGADKDVRITATLPESMSFVHATGPTQGKAEGRTVTFDPVPTLGAGQAATWNVEVRAERADDARFQIDLSSQSLSKPVTETEPTRVY